MMIGGRQGNGTCFECGANIKGLKSADGESAWADCGRGVVLCGECGEGKRAALHLRLDAFCEADLRAMLAGGNQQLRSFSVRYPKAVEQYAATLAAEAGPRISRGVAAAVGELRVVVSRRFSIVETHGHRAAVQVSQHPELLVGDYIVGVGQARVWRFSEVVNALERAGKTGVSLLISRVPIEHPEMCVVELSRSEDAPVPMEMAVSGGGPSSSYAGHAVVLGYWTTFGDHDDDAPAPTPAAPRPQVRRRELAALSLGPGAPLRADVYRRVGRPNGFASAVLRQCRDAPHLDNAVVVGVNDRRSQLQYKHVLDALNELRRPVLLVLAVEPRQLQSDDPPADAGGT